MNRFVATVSSMESFGSLHTIVLSVAKRRVIMRTIELPENIETGFEISIGVKSFDLVLSSENPEDISLCNTLPVKIDSVERGETLTRVLLSFENTTLEALICARRAEKMNLSPGMEIFASFHSCSLFFREKTL